MSIDRINGLNFNAYIGKTSNVQKAGETEALFKSSGIDNKSFYPGLSFSPEARMAAEMNKSHFMQGLNELFGIDNK